MTLEQKALYTRVWRIRTARSKLFHLYPDELNELLAEVWDEGYQAKGADKNPFETTKMGKKYGPLRKRVADFINRRGQGDQGQ